MSITTFMKGELPSINNIIKSMPNDEFDSHEFIRHFARKYEAQYVKFLGTYPLEPFRIVHMQIAKFLSEYKSDLDIMDLGETESENIFGDISKNEKWKRIIS